MESESVAMASWGGGAHPGLLMDQPGDRTTKSDQMVIAYRKCNHHQGAVHEGLGDVAL